ncbi:Ldh family oxidoreductase [Roseicyclus persicicus]|uniref:Ldh family oxidoreductase n=1 Tax=Roseicyclus persicicus TaxID=2650661 RepID=A0A7X6H198_9RHOB|nr:Ldh family oxidoreductase [Roseibacterium persicicum]NKX45469.1 hypothetical protein [Roseibacterium persicicum]
MTELLSLPDLHALARDCLTRAGVPDRVAEAVAAETAAAEAAGARRHGMEALLRDIRLLRYGRIDAAAAPAITRPRPGLLEVDARHGFAAAALATALDEFAGMARDAGVAMLRLERASDPGVLGSALAALAAHGLAARRLDLAAPGALACAVRQAPAETGAPDDDPLGPPVAHGATLLALPPWEGAAAVAKAPPPVARIALPADLIARIVTA